LKNSLTIFLQLVPTTD